MEGRVDRGSLGIGLQKKKQKERKTEDLYLLKTSKASLGAGGTLHLGVADCVGQ